MDTPSREMILGMLDKFMPASRRPIITERYNGKTAGDWLRSSFRREFGRGIQSRWFD